MFPCMSTVAVVVVIPAAVPAAAAAVALVLFLPLLLPFFLLLLLLLLFLLRICLFVLYILACWKRSARVSTPSSGLWTPAEPECAAHAVVATETRLR